MFEEKIQKQVAGPGQVGAVDMVIKHETQYRVLVAFGENGIGLALDAVIRVVHHLVIHNLLQGIVVIDILLVFTPLEDN